MKRFHGNRTLAMLLFPFISVEMLSAAPPDPKLLSLVPPGTQLVAGLNNRTPAGHARRISPDEPATTRVDRRDFISLVGVDDSMIINQLIFAAGGGDTSRIARAQSSAKRAFQRDAHLPSCS